MNIQMPQRYTSIFGAFFITMQQLTPGELKTWLINGVAHKLVDVRELWERKQYNIGGDHIPMNELRGSCDQLPKDIPVILYCEKGIRSVIAIQRLETMGFDNLYNLAGGMDGWKRTERE